MDLHTNSMVIFHSFLYVYQRVMFPFKPPTKGISDFHRWSPEIQPFRAMPLGESYQPFIPRKYHQRVKILLIMFLQFLHKLLFFFLIHQRLANGGYGWIWMDMDGYGGSFTEHFMEPPLVPTTTTHQQPTTTDSAARTKCSAPRRGPTKQKKPRTFHPWKDGRIFRGGSRLHRCR